MEKTKLLSILLADARSITRFFLSNLKEKDVYHKFEIDGIQLNNIIWIVGHLAWAQDAFILKNLNTGVVSPDWLSEFGVGSKCPTENNGPTYSEVYATFKDINNKSIEALPLATTEKLAQDNMFGFGFGDNKSVEMLIRHCIRHESNHAGQLGWLCKLNGIKTM